MNLIPSMSSEIRHLKLLPHMIYHILPIYALSYIPSATSLVKHLTGIRFEYICVTKCMQFATQMAIYWEL